MKIKIEENFDINIKYMVFVWMIKIEEDFIEESFYVICKISESIIWESFEEFELEFMGDLRMLEFNIGEN